MAEDETQPDAPEQDAEPTTEPEVSEGREDVTEDAAPEPEGAAEPEPEAAPEPEAEAAPEPEAEAPAPEPEAEEAPGFEEATSDVATPESVQEAVESGDTSAAAPEADVPEETDVQEAATRRAEAADAERRPRGKRSERGPDDAQQPEVVPGAHLEPDLVLEEQRRSDSEFGEYQEAELAEGEEAPSAEADEAAPAPVAATPLELAADARYQATGKRKTSVARVILRPGKGEYRINGKPLDVYFPRATLQTQVKAPLDTTGNGDRMDVVAKIHGGGVAAQAGALRHGVARALVEADPNLRGELKRRGFLTRDARVKERKKAGLKKARKRPQFSKR